MSYNDTSYYAMLHNFVLSLMAIETRLY